ncbi:argininosuccinate lyase [Citreicella sp. C3M06]|nr:argininosuccinate lyase [Citreicella sp. C3M06]MBU2959719.1 argininosuccinate lyase [Citreicella sp. C3M06]
MKSLATLALALLIAGCGADGEPVAPKAKSDSAIQLSVSGTAEMGVSGGW